MYIGFFSVPYIFKQKEFNKELQMTDKEYKKLAKLVTYLLESEDWKTVWLNEYAEPIKLFMYKTGITYRRVMRYIRFAMNKLLGEQYELAQRKLANKCCGHEDPLFKPKSKFKSDKPRLPNNSNKGKTITPHSEFGKLYVAHYGYGSAKNVRQYNRERHFYEYHGRCSWQ